MVVLMIKLIQTDKSEFTDTCPFIKSGRSSLRCLVRCIISWVFFFICFITVLTLSQNKEIISLFATQIIETALKNVNWHGMNTKNLIQHIIEDETIDNANLSILKYSFGDNECFICDSFMDEFKLISPDLQEFVISLFAKALQSGLLFPARGDDNIVKKCDADNVYELRNHAYGGIRVYFRCVDNKIFIGNMGTKSSYKGDAQSNDIAHAGKVMDKLERTMRN